MERELAMVGGDLAEARVDRDHVRFPGGDAEALRRWVAERRADPAHADPHSASTPSNATVATRWSRFGDRVVPVPQEVAGRQVSCHLHGVVGPAS